MRVNYSADKRRRELAAKQKKEEKAQKMAERKALKAQYPDGIPPELLENGDTGFNEDAEDSEGTSDPDASR